MSSHTRSEAISAYLRIVDESASFCVWRLIPSSCIFKALNDSLKALALETSKSRRVTRTYGLATPIMTDDDGYWTIELYHREFLVTERSNPSNSELVQGCPRFDAPVSRGTDNSVKATNITEKLGVGY